MMRAVISGRLSASLGLALVVLVTVSFVSVTNVQAALSVIDPDFWSDGTNISSLTPGVTLSNSGSLGDGDVYAITSGTSEPVSPSTGGLVFGWNPTSTDRHLWAFESVTLFRADFAAGVDEVYIDFLGNNSSDVGVMRAYDAGASLLESYFSPSIGLGGVHTLTINRGGAFDIAYITASGFSADNGGLDNLRYSGPIPEPSTLAIWSLLALCGIGYGWRRRKT